MEVQSETTILREMDGKIEKAVVLAFGIVVIVVGVEACGRTNALRKAGPMTKPLLFGLSSKLRDGHSQLQGTTPSPPKNGFCPPPSTSSEQRAILSSGAARQLPPLPQHLKLPPSTLRSATSAHHRFHRVLPPRAHHTSKAPPLFRPPPIHLGLSC